jgi:hypothetical protein
MVKSSDEVRDVPRVLKGSHGDGRLTWTLIPCEIVHGDSLHLKIKKNLLTDATFPRVE